MLPPPGGRFLALDGLRGVAALLVLVFHAFWNTADSEFMREQLPELVVLSTGFLRSGVAVFFVISGFVIAYTTRSLHTGDQAWRFIVRRQVRLDPPYYAMIAVALIIEGVQALIPGLVHATFTPGEVLLNMLYLQGIVGVPSVLAVAWTLCLEVQFYLVVVIVALGATRLSRSPETRTGIQVGVVVALMLLSLTFGLVGVPPGPWVLGTWWMFAIGMILAWFVAGLIRLWLVYAALATLLVWGIGMSLVGRADPWGGEWFAIATAMLVAFLVLSRLLGRSPGTVMLYFGRISYSLYLAHLPVLIVVSGIVVKLLPDSFVARLAGLVISVAAAICAAHILYHTVEKRAVAWSKRVPRSKHDVIDPPRGATTD